MSVSVFMTCLQVTPVYRTKDPFTFKINDFKLPTELVGDIVTCCGRDVCECVHDMLAGDASLPHQRPLHLQNQRLQAAYRAG